jgi:hypothetical protein
MDGNGGGFFRRDDPKVMTFLRRRLGDEAFEHWQRGLELSEHPRPLADTERAVLREAATPVLRDLAATGTSVPVIREEAHEEGGEMVCGWLEGADGTGQGIRVALQDSPGVRLADLADQVQEWVTGELHAAGESPVWPPCPRHPNHPLQPKVRDEMAVWICPGTSQAISVIGALAGYLRGPYHVRSNGSA